MGELPRPPGFSDPGPDENSADPCARLFGPSPAGGDAREMVREAELILAVDVKTREVCALAGPAAVPRREPGKVLRVEVDFEAGQLDDLVALVLAMTDERRRTALG